MLGRLGTRRNRRILRAIKDIARETRDQRLETGDQKQGSMGAREQGSAKSKDRFEPSQTCFRLQDYSGNNTLLKRKNAER